MNASLGPNGISSRLGAGGRNAGAGAADFYAGQADLDEQTQRLREAARDEQKFRELREDKSLSKEEMDANMDSDMKLRTWWDSSKHPYPRKMQPEGAAHYRRGMLAADWGEVRGGKGEKHYLVDQLMHDGQEPVQGARQGWYDADGIGKIRTRQGTPRAD